MQLFGRAFSLFFFDARLKILDGNAVRHETNEKQLHAAKAYIIDMTISENLARIRKTLPDHPVTLVAVSKSVGIEEIKEAFKSGVTEFGENRIQDAIKKQEAMPEDIARHIHWHFIGHLQSNKVKKALGRFVLIHSVDTWHLAEEISKEAVKRGQRQPVLLQVKVMEDPDKSGFEPEQLKAVFGEIHALPGLSIEGLMTMTPLSADGKMRQACFWGLKKLKEDLENLYTVSLKELSMGMTDDYEEALKCGATMLRVGRAIFQKTEN